MLERYQTIALLLLAILTLVLSQHGTFRSFNAKNNKVVALTFDDGPHQVLTHQLLDSLKQLQLTENITAHVTFYVMGVKTHLHPDILKKAVSDGHEIGNHGWNHPVLSQISWDDLRIQLRETSQAIYNATGIWPSTMRPPYGKTNGGLNKRIFNELQLSVILWSLDTLDWQRPSTESIVKKVIESVKPGTIILCHDIHPNSIPAVPVIVRELTKKGFSFRTVRDLINLFHPKMLPVLNGPPS
eukprot:gene747-811_t